MAIRHWSKEEDNFLKENYFQMMYKDIGKILNRTDLAVSMRCIFLGLIKIKLVQVGKIFGKLTVTRSSERRDKNGARYFFCDCACGNKNIEVRGYHLTRGTVRSCGCLVKESGLKKRLEGKDISYNKLEQSCKTGAIRRGYEYSLSREEFRSIIVQSCHYCGAAARPYNVYYKLDGSFTLKGKKVTKEFADLKWINVNGIDRKNNNIGYIIKNCVACCPICNKAKLDLSYKKFVEYLNRVAKFRT